MNKQELVNELTVLLAAYPLLLFTTWIWESKPRNEAGWFIVACIIANVCFNMTIAIVFLVATLKSKIKFACIRRKKRKEMEKRLKNQIEREETNKRAKE